MIKKLFATAAFFGFLIAFGLSCTSPFSPSTNLGKNVLNSIDSSIADLKGGFKKDSFNLAVLSARSTIIAGADTSSFVLQSGDHPLTLMAGGMGGDSAVGYVEFHLATSNLATLRAACSTSKADSVYLMLHYVAANNDTGHFKGHNTIKVYSCGRKFFPHFRNDLSSVDGAGPSTLSFSRDSTSDSVFAVPLAGDIVGLLNSAVADTNAYVRHVVWADTLIGNVKSDSVRPLRPDTGFSAGPWLYQAMQDTITGIAKIDTVQSIIKRDSVFGRDTAIVSCMAVQSSGTAVTLVKADTLPFTDSIIQITSALFGDTAIIAYTAVRSRKIITAFSYDSSQKYIGALHLYASGGGLVRFSGLSFRIKYRNACSDTVRQTLDNASSAYYSTTVIETAPIPADSLVASWQADRFVELKVDLQPFWNSILGAGTGKSFRIVQDASFSLAASDPVFERVGTADTTRAILFGMLDHQITGSRAQSSGTRDSLSRTVNAISVNPSTTQISLPLATFLQSMYEKNQRPAEGYLYLFVKSPNHFARVIFGNRNAVKTISCSALFSNPQK
jgi:hypothetical protein